MPDFDARLNLSHRLHTKHQYPPAASGRRRRTAVIMMEQPSFCINSHDVPGPHYKMWKTVDAPAGTTSFQVASQISTWHQAALANNGGGLRNIIINCHGGGGRLYMGGLDNPPIDISNVNSFSILKTMNVGTIWLVACKAALGATGKTFCQSLATIAGTQVIASDESQEVTPYQTYRYYLGLSGQIDDFEGTVYGFTVVGGMHAGIDPEDFVWTVKT
jgi:hypothetical protein